MQFHHEAGVLNVSEEPEGGYYLLVADAYSINKNKTRVDNMYNVAIRETHPPTSASRDIELKDLSGCGAFFEAQ